MGDPSLSINKSVLSNTNIISMQIHYYVITAPCNPCVFKLITADRERHCWDSLWPSTHDHLLRQTTEKENVILRLLLGVSSSWSNQELDVKHRSRCRVSTSRRLMFLFSTDLCCVIDQLQVNSADSASVRTRSVSFTNFLS